jgi:hypothetical protein
VPVTTVALAGLITMWSNAPLLTCSDAVPIAPTSVPVTVCAPPAVAVQMATMHEPFGLMVNVVSDVASPSEFS